MRWDEMSDGETVSLVLSLVWCLLSVGPVWWVKTRDAIARILNPDIKRSKDPVNVIS